MKYQPAGAVLDAFRASDAFVRGIRGPIGSGKSTACVAEILRRALVQAPGPDGVRRSRWAVIRNTYPELRTTTIKTWQQWVPRDAGKWQIQGPPCHRLWGAAEAGERFDLEVLFLALDRDEDVHKLLSLELTGAWINEAREVPRTIVDALTGRVGRYPPAALGGPSWYGILMDSNASDTDHWWYRLAEDRRPEGWEFFAQPAGDGAAAENLANLPAFYYDRVKQGKDEDWVRVYVRGEYGYVREGKPVFPEWREALHLAPRELAANPELPIHIGVDFGLSPAAVFCQRDPGGRWMVLDEIVTEEMGAKRLGDLIAQRLADRFPRIEAMAWGDPAGNAASQTDERSCIDVLAEAGGIEARPAPSNRLAMRLEAVRATLTRLVDGTPGLSLSPRCRFLRKGFAGGYRFRRLAVAGDERWREEPEKNRYSHPHDALQYALLGGGEARALTHRASAQAGRRQSVAEDDYPIL